MRCRLLAAGTRLPAWIDAGVDEYSKRLRKPLQFELREIPLATRHAGENPHKAVAREGATMLAALGRDDFVIALDIAGDSMSTPQFSAWLGRRIDAGRPLALMIGGPDGLAPQCLERADSRWSLSPLTLPHALARLVVVEQIYRAMSLLAGHPYHRA